MKRAVIYSMIILLFLTAYSTNAQRRKNREAISSATKIREAEYYFTEAEKYYILEDYAKALALFQRSLELDPNNSAGYYKKAQIEFKGEDYSKAMDDAKRAIEIDSSNKYYYLLFIEILTEQGRFDEALETYEQLITSVENTDHFLYEMAAIYLFQEEFDKALEIFTRLEERFGQSEEIMLQRHKIFNQQGKKEEALRELDYLVETFPLNENYPIALAEYYLGRSESDKSIEVLENMLEIFPANPRALLLLGEIHRKDEDYEKAIPYLQSAFQNSDLSPDLKVQLIAQYRTLPRTSDRDILIKSLCDVLEETHPSEANVYAIYGDFLLEMNMTEKAAEKYRASLKIDDSNFGVWQNLILLYSSNNDFDNVIVTADKAMVVFPNQNIFYYLSGFAHLRKSMYQEAIYLLKAGIRLSTNDQKMTADFKSLLGEAYHGIKDYSRSDQAFEEVLAEQPDNYLVLNNYAYYLAVRNENLEKAEKMASKLVKENPDNANYMDTYAWVLYTRKKYKDARKIAEKALDSGKATAVHYEHYGDILFKLGDVDGAVIQWQMAKGMDSTLKFIDRKIADRKLYEK